MHTSGWGRILAGDTKKRKQQLLGLLLPTGPWEVGAANQNAVLMVPHNEAPWDNRISLFGGFAVKNALTGTVTQPRGVDLRALLDVNDVARLLHCSPRHVYRMADGGLLPAPVKLGALVRWRHQDIDTWLAGGCGATSGAGQA
jgi:excisionase family DNA binding protein